MRNMLKTTIIASLVAATAFAGAAQADVYFELGATQISADFGDQNIEHFGVAAVLGTTLKATDTFAHKAEAIAIIGANADKVNGGYDAKMQSLIGAAYRPTFKINDSVELYARLGAFNGRAKVSGFGMSETDSSTEVGFGVGIDFKKVSLSYLNVDNVNFLTATYRF